jgi:hypothetical protein
MATYREIDPSMLGQQTPKIDLTGMANNDQNLGFREVDPTMLGQAMPQQAPTTQGRRSLYNDLSRQVGLTARYGLEGAGQVADIVGTPLNMLINRATGSRLGTPSQSMSNIATMLGLPQPETGLERGVGNVTRAVAGVAATGGVGGLLQQSGRATTQAVGQGLAAQPVAQMAGATAGTGAAEIARGQFDVQNPAALLAINLAAGLPASAVAARAGNIPSGTRYRDPQTGQLIESAAKRGVKIDVEDVGGPGASLLESSRQFGKTTQISNQAQSAQVRNLVERVTDNLKPANMAAGGEKLVIAKDLRQQYRTAKDNVSPIFDRAEKLAGNNAIPLQNTNNATVNVLDQFPATADTAVINKVIERTNNLLQAGGGTYKELRDIQSTVGAELSRVQRGVPGGAYNEKQVNALSQLYKGMADDVDAWAAPRTLNNRPVYTPAGAEHARAMQQFKDTVVPFRQNPDIYKLVSSKTPANEIDSVAQSFTLTGNPATAELAVNLMSPVGKQAAQYSILNEARSKAITPDAATSFSAPAFTRTLNLGRPDMPTAERIIMGQNPVVMEEVGLLRDIVDATRGAVTPKVTPQTGALAIPLITTGMGAGAGRAVAQMLGANTEVGMGLGALAGASLTPPISRGLGNVLGSQTGTRYLLGEQLQGAGGMGGALGQGINAATNNPDEFFPRGQGLLNMFRD